MTIPLPDEIDSTVATASCSSPSCDSSAVSSASAAAQFSHSTHKQQQSIHNRARASKLKSKQQIKRAQSKIKQRREAAAAPITADYSAEDLAAELDDDDQEADDSADSRLPQLPADYRSWDECEQDAFLSCIVSSLRLRCCREGTSPGDATSLFVPAVESSGKGSRGRAGTDTGSWFEGANAVNSFFLDDFLYSREARLQLIDRGQLELFYCSKCERVIEGDCRRKTEEQRKREEKDREDKIEEIKKKFKSDQSAALTATPPESSPLASASDSLSRLSLSVSEQPHANTLPAEESAPASTSAAADAAAASRCLWRLLRKLLQVHLRRGHKIDDSYLFYEIDSIGAAFASSAGQQIAALRFRRRRSNVTQHSIDHIQILHYACSKKICRREKIEFEHGGLIRNNLGSVYQ